MRTNPVLFHTLVTHILLKMNACDDFLLVLRFLDKYIFDLSLLYGSNCSCYQSCYYLHQWSINQCFLISLPGKRHRWSKHPVVYIISIDQVQCFLFLVSKKTFKMMIIQRRGSRIPLKTRLKYMSRNNSQGKMAWDALSKYERDMAIKLKYINKALWDMVVASPLFELLWSNLPLDQKFAAVYYFGGTVRDPLPPELVL